MTDLAPPCFDPTCACCNAWRSLDDQRIEQIELLQQEIELLKFKVDVLTYVPPSKFRQEYDLADDDD